MVVLDFGVLIMLMWVLFGDYLFMMLFKKMIDEHKRPKVSSTGQKPTPSFLFFSQFCAHHHPAPKCTAPARQPNGGHLCFSSCFWTNLPLRDAPS